LTTTSLDSTNSFRSTSLTGALEFKDVSNKCYGDKVQVEAKLSDKPQPTSPFRVGVKLSCRASDGSQHTFMGSTVFNTVPPSTDSAFVLSGHPWDDMMKLTNTCKAQLVLLDDTTGSQSVLATTPSAISVLPTKDPLCSRTTTPVVTGAIALNPTTPNCINNTVGFQVKVTGGYTASSQVTAKLLCKDDTVDTFIASSCFPHTAGIEAKACEKLSKPTFGDVDFSVTGLSGTKAECQVELIHSYKGKSVSKLSVSLSTMGTEIGSCTS